VHLNTALTPRAYWRDLVYMVVAKLCGALVLYQIHGGARPQAFCRGHRLRVAFVRATLRLPDAIIALSTTERNAFRRFVGSTEVITIPHAVDCTPYATLVRHRSKPEAPLNLLYVGRLAREKGLYELLRGLQVAHAQGVAAELVIAGGGPEEALLQQSVLAFGLGRVTFVGPVRGAGKIALLSRADVFVLASYAEGLPYALLESMAAGVPVIATRVGAIPDLVTDGVNGLLIDPKDPAAIAAAIARLAGDRDFLARMSDASRTTIAARYSVGRLAAEFCRLYADVCGRRTRLRTVRP
jgi:glycosyltransferase involved in cell wall biosynthesis